MNDRGALSPYLLCNCLVLRGSRSLTPVSGEDVFAYIGYLAPWPPGDPAQGCSQALRESFLSGSEGVGLLPTPSTIFIGTNTSS
jgi:hypothetical protein